MKENVRHYVVFYFKSFGDFSDSTQEIPERTMAWAIEKLDELSSLPDYLYFADCPEDKLVSGRVPSGRLQNRSANIPIGRIVEKTTQKISIESYSGGIFNLSITSIEGIDYLHRTF